MYLLNDAVSSLVTQLWLLVNECVWCIGRMILTGEKGTTWKKAYPMPLCPPQITLDWSDIEPGLSR